MIRSVQNPSVDSKLYLGLASICDLPGGGLHIGSNSHKYDISGVRSSVKLPILVCKQSRKDQCSTETDHEAISHRASPREYLHMGVV